MSNDAKEFAATAAATLRAYAQIIENSYWDQPDPDDPRCGNVELMIPQAEDMTEGLAIIARFLETMFDEGGAA